MAATVNLPLPTQNGKVRVVVTESHPQRTLQALAQLVMCQMAVSAVLN